MNGVEQRSFGLVSKLDFRFKLHRHQKYNLQTDDRTFSSGKKTPSQRGQKNLPFQGNKRPAFAKMVAPLYLIVISASGKKTKKITKRK